MRTTGSAVSLLVPGRVAMSRTAVAAVRWNAAGPVGAEAGTAARTGVAARQTGKDTKRSPSRWGRHFTSRAGNTATGR
jgi:hypothetical protein